jgi:hypothetical protein
MSGEATPFFSVVLPVAADYDITGAVGSVVAQTFADWELLIVQAEANQAEFAAVLGRIPPHLLADPRVRVLKAGVGGPAATNRGFQEGRGPWVIGLAVSHAFYPDCLANFAEFIRANPDTQSVFGEMDWLVDGRLMRFKPRAPGRRWGLLESFCHGAPAPACTCSRREAVFESGGFTDGIRICSNDLLLQMCRKYGLRALGRSTCVRKKVEEPYREAADGKAAFAMMHERLAASLAPGELPAAVVARRVSNLFYASGRKYFLGGEYGRAARVLRRSLAHRPTIKASLLLRLAEAVLRIRSGGAARRRARSA